MKIERVKISNILGIERLEFEAGQFNEITGGNERGKTSVMEAIKSVFAGGEDATLLRRGEDKGEVVLVLDDGTELKKKVTPNGSTVTVEKDGVRQPKAQTTINALRDMMSVNPIEFLRMGSTPAGKRGRVATLLEALPTKIDPARLTQIVGHPVELNPDLPAVEQLDAVYASVSDDRKGTNRAIREKEGTISQLAATLPKAGEGGPSGDPEELEAQIAGIDAELTATLGRVQTQLDKYADESRGREDAARKKHGEEIERLQALIVAEREARAAAIAAEVKFMANTRERAEAKREEFRTGTAAKREPLAAQLLALRQNASATARAAQTRQTIATLRAEADELVVDSEKQTKALTNLEAYKSELLDSIPIEGLAVRDGEIFRADVPFDRLNAQTQVEIAVEIAKLRAGQIGVICVDGLELMDAEHLEDFQAKAIDSGLQLFVTRVNPDGGELAVSTYS